MGYSQYQVKYINTPIISYSLPDIEQEIPEMNLGNITYLNGEAASPTALIQQEEPVVKQNPVKKIIKKPATTPSFRPSRGLAQFNLDFDEALKVGGEEARQLQSRRGILTHLAQVESTFDSTRKNPKAPAYGYFQFMQGLYNGNNHDNIRKHAGVDIDTFRRSPILQIRAANSLANEFLSIFGKSNIERLHKLGWTDNAILAGAWLGGPKNVMRYAFRGIDTSDGADSVGKRMKKFNY